MEFGYVENLEGVDLSLPPDHPDTTRILNESKKKKKPIFRIGCAKWGRKPWVGHFYPPGTKEKDYLLYYAKNFNSIELNATFYRIPTAKTLEEWKEKAGPGFKFSPKFPQQITHFARLKNADAATTEFIEAMKMLGDNLGTFFLQLPQNFSLKNQPALIDYLDSLPKDIHVNVEFRQKDWFGPSDLVDETFSFLESKGFGTVISDAAGRRDAVHMRMTNGTAFIRFVGNLLHPTDYERLDEWVDRLDQWLKEGLHELNFFMHQHEELHSPILCAYFIRKLNERCKLSLQEPVIYDENGNPANPDDKDLRNNSNLLFPE